jgi:hypothetical protein
MAERATISQSCQIGVETTPGTGVTASKKMGGIGFVLSPAIETSAQRPSGQKYAANQILNQEWSSLSIDGGPCYTELPYIFASLMSAPTVTEYMDSSTHTGAFRWVFDSNPSDDDAPKTFTIEQGSSSRASKAVGCLITGIEFVLSRSEISLSGEGIGSQYQDGITMTAAPTRLAQIPVRPTELSFYSDPTWAALGTTKLTRALSATFSLSDRYGPLWVVDASKPSYAATVETVPTLEVKLLQVADASGMAPLVQMRAGATACLRFEAVGPRIYDGAVTDYYHKMTIDVAAQVTAVAEPSDEDGVYAIEWTLGGVVDSVSSKVVHVEIVTTTSAL